MKFFEKLFKSKEEEELAPDMSRYQLSTPQHLIRPNFRKEVMSAGGAGTYTLRLGPEGDIYDRNPYTLKDRIDGFYYNALGDSPQKVAEKAQEAVCDAMGGIWVLGLAGPRGSKLYLKELDLILDAAAYLHVMKNCRWSDDSRYILGITRSGSIHRPQVGGNYLAYVNKCRAYLKLSPSAFSPEEYLSY